MTETDRLLLDLAGRRYRYGAALETDVRRETGLSLVQFWQTVAALTERPDVEAEYPQLVRRLRRLAGQRRDVRRAG